MLTCGARRRYTVTGCVLHPGMRPCAKEDKPLGTAERLPAAALKGMAGKAGGARARWHAKLRKRQRKKNGCMKAIHKLCVARGQSRGHRKCISH